jgi:hypothetical protein
MYAFIVTTMHSTLLSSIVSFYSNAIIAICLPMNRRYILTAQCFCRFKLTSTFTMICITHAQKKMLFTAFNAFPVQNFIRILGSYQQSCSLLLNSGWWCADKKKCGWSDCSVVSCLSVAIGATSYVSLHGFATVGPNCYCSFYGIHCYKYL